MGASSQGESQLPLRTVQYLTFLTAGEEYAISIVKIREIIEYEVVTTVPNTPQWISGVTNLRGKVIPVVDLAVKFGLPASRVSKFSCIIITDVLFQGENLTMGVLADSVSQVIDLSADEIEKTPPFGTRVKTEYLLGMGALGKKFCLILDIDKVLSGHSKNNEALSEGIFINLLVGNAAGADHLHEILKANKPVNGEFTECLYYYGRNQPLLAAGHCRAAITENETAYGAWSNAGYVALDNADFPSAASYFAKALQLFNASKDKHTVTQELDVCWGVIVAEYYSGDKKDAKILYRAVKKDYPKFVTMAALRQLPLVWSENTAKLIEKVAADFK